jgi:hypothetical protein
MSANGQDDFQPPKTTSTNQVRPIESEIHPWQSLGIDQAEYQRRYPGLNKDTGFSISQLPRDLINQFRAFGITPPPANPSQVERQFSFDDEDDETEDNSKEKYTHSGAHHTNIVQGLVRLPFDIYQCTPLLDLIKATGVTIAAKFPTKDELQRGLDQLKKTYPEYLARSKASGLKSSWQQPHQEWQFTYPIRHPSPKIYNNRADNAAQNKANAAARRVARGLPAEAPSTKARKPAPRPTGSDPGKPISDDTVLYGCRVTDLPPNVVQYYRQALRSVYDVYRDALESLAGEMNELNARLDGRIREARALARRYNYPSRCRSLSTQMKTFRVVFGDWAVMDQFDDWLNRPPMAEWAIPGYEDALGAVKTAFGNAFESRDRARYDTICDLDTSAMEFITRLEHNRFIADMTRTTINEWLGPMITVELRYAQLHTSPYPRLIKVMSTLTDKCYESDRSSVGEWETMDNKEREVAWKIRQRLGVLEQERAVRTENGSLDTTVLIDELQDHSVAAAAEHCGDTFQIKDILIGTDYGVEAFRGMDAWDLVVYLGLVDYQDPHQRDLAQILGKEEAHLRLCDENGSPIKGDDGEWIWTTPEVHFARMRITFPGINRYEDQPRNSHDWDRYIQQCARDGITPTRSSTTHSPIYPSVHQLAAVANIMARGYLDPRYAPHHSHTLLQDDVGVGKTLEFFMVITLLEHYRHFGDLTPSTCPPVMQPWKKYWSTGRRMEGSDQPVDCNAE